MKRSDQEIERNDFLRRCVPGDELELECWDFKTRKVTVTARIEKQNGGVTLKAEGHGTTYQIDVSGPDYPGASVRIIWTSGNSQVRYARLKKESDHLWSSVTAADLGVPSR